MSLSCAACGADIAPPAPAPPGEDSPCPGCGADLLLLRQLTAARAAALREAHRRLLVGHFHAALRALGRAAALGDDGPRWRRLRGLALLGAGRPSAALPLLGLGPDDDGAPLAAAAVPLLQAEARYLAARAQAAAGDLDGAGRTLAAGPASRDGLLLYGLCARHRGDAAAARAAFLCVLRADPTDLRAAAWAAETER